MGPPNESFAYRSNAGTSTSYENDLPLLIIRWIIRRDQRIDISVNGPCQLNWESPLKIIRARHWGSRCVVDWEF
jgi:hypothetical protein